MPQSTTFDDPHRGRRILVVEDDTILGAILVDMLEELGCVVVGIARTAAGAVSAAREHLPDVVMLDINLAEGSDGIEAAREINRAQVTSFVFVTGRADERTWQRAKAAVPCSYVVKPFDMAAIDAALQRRA
jgi:two-component system, response regulator PdtaR